MAYPKKLLRLRPTQGLVSDTPSWEVGPDHYTFTRNVVFRNGFAEVAPALASVYETVQDDVRNIINVQIGGVNYWVYHGSDKSYVVQTDTHSDITIEGGLQAVDKSHFWTSGVLNGVVFANNGLDAPMYWPGSPDDEFEVLPDWPEGTVCKALVAHKYHLFALDIDGPSGNFPAQLMWSSAAEPGSIPQSWTPDPSNDAGDTILSDTPGPIITARNLRGSLMIYKTGSTHVADYIGGNEVYNFRTLFVQSGCLNRHSVADVNGQHLVVTDGDIILTDGTNIQSIAQARVRRFLFDQLDQDNYQNLFVIYHRARSETWVCFPESGAEHCTLALVYDHANDAWGTRELPSVSCAGTGIVNDVAVSNTWDSDNEPWNSDLTPWNRQQYSLATEHLVFGQPETPALLQAGAGTTPESVIGRYALTFDEPERVKFVKRVHVRVDADPEVELSLRLGQQMATDGSITWGSPQTFTSQNPIINAFAQGRFISVEITAAQGAEYTVTGIDLEAEVRGYF